MLVFLTQRYNFSDILHPKWRSEFIPMIGTLRQSLVVTCPFFYIFNVYFELSGIGNVNTHFARSVATLSNTYPGKIANVISNSLSSEEITILKNILTAANVQL